MCLSHRAEWPKDHFIPPYVPRFRNGWEPPLLNFMGAPKEQELNHLAESVANVAEQQRKQEMKRLSSEVSYCRTVLLISSLTPAPSFLRTRGIPGVTTVEAPHTYRKL